MLHISAILEHWEQAHGIPRAWDVYPARTEHNEAIGEFRIARPMV